MREFCDCEQMASFELYISEIFYFVLFRNRKCKLNAVSRKMLRYRIYVPAYCGIVPQRP